MKKHLENRNPDAFYYTFSKMYTFGKTYSKGKITSHMMRHLYAAVLYQESGHDAAFVQEQLRHSDVNTTLGTYAAGDSRSYEVLENR